MKASKRNDGMWKPTINGRFCEFKGTKKLRDRLLLNYGSLMYDLSKCNDYFEKRQIVGRMNVINAFLKVPKIEHKSPLLQIIKCG